MIDINALKATIRDCLRDRIHPKQLTVHTEEPLGGTVNFEVGQQFIPFSTVLRDNRTTVPVSLMLKRVLVPEDGIKVSLVEDSDDYPSENIIASSTIPAESIPATMGTVTTNIILREPLDSKSKYWLMITPLCPNSETEYYSVGRATIDTAYWSGFAIKREIGQSEYARLSGDLYFDFTIPNFIYTDYPRADLSKTSYPRIAIGLMARPATIQRVIDARCMDYILSFDIVAYSLYPDELDNLITLIDRAIFEKRTSLENIWLVNPSRITPITIVREFIFTRGVLFDARCRMEVSS